jgi:uncharacterized protein (TIGR02270 family)
LNVIPDIVDEHAQEVATLHALRTAVLRSWHIRLSDLQRGFDDRISLHFDGLRIAGEHAWLSCESAFEPPTAGAVFAATVVALQDRNPSRVDRLFAVTEAVSDSKSGLVSAFGWLGAEQLRGVVADLLKSGNSFRRVVGISACSLHRVDPALVAAGYLRDGDSAVRARALRLCGELGCDEAMTPCVLALGDVSPLCRAWAAWSSVVLGNRREALDALQEIGLNPGPLRERAFDLTLQAMRASEAQRILRDLATAPDEWQRLIRGCGIVGDPVYVPWLIEQMQEPKAARLAAGAFSLITGVELSEHGLEAAHPPVPEDMDEMPVDDLDDVDLDLAGGLTSPDPERVAAFWAENSVRFQPGSRYFMGAPVTKEHCIDVLKNGYQRQRILAAHYLCLLEPGTPLFNTSAPAWRQQRLLARM